MRVICVAGARPNYMKIKPVMDALEERGAEVILVHTGQHYDAAMSDVFFTDLAIRKPDYFLGAGSGSHAVQTGRVMTAFEPLAEQVRPDVVVVVGDVNSTMACALVTAKSGALLAHVEAGLRSRDWSMPEEINRVVTDRVSDYLFAPSADAAANLQAEGYRDDQIQLAGNVMVDTLLANIDRATRGGTLSRLGLEPGGYGLATLHRPANVDDPAVLATLLPALDEVARLCPLVLPAHPRAAGRLRDAGISGRIRVIPPAGYLDFIALQASARLVLTDSGGIQEETTVLGVPCLTLRDNTERPVTLTEGTNQLVGRDPARILAAARQVLADPPAPRRPALWDGHAGQRIAQALVTGATRERPRPTDSPAGPHPCLLATASGASAG
jgi:UDP-N-acetylglucosamine 2-epimerase (non-hydrolysing)